MEWMTEPSWSVSKMEKRFLSSPKHPVQLCGPSSFLFKGYSGVKWLGHAADHSPQSSADIKNEWSYNDFKSLLDSCWCRKVNMPAGEMGSTTNASSTVFSLFKEQCLINERKSV